MPKGRPKKPDGLKLLEGNPGKRPLNGAAPIPEGTIQRPPYVTGYAAEVWNQIVNSMPPALYTSADSIVLASFCVATAQWRQATEEISKDGVTVVTTQGDLKPHPALQAQSKALTTMALLGGKLGLDPSSRASLKMPPQRKPESKFNGLVNTNSAENGAAETAERSQPREVAA